MGRRWRSTLFDRVVAWSLERRMSAAARYALATGAVFVVGVLRLSFSVTEQVPWLLFIPAILMVALLADRGPGLLAVLLSAVVGTASLLRVDGAGSLSRQQWVAVGLFMVVAVTIVLIAVTLRDAMRRAATLNHVLRDREIEAHEREALMTSVLAASTDCIKVLELDGSISFMSEGGLKVMDISDFNDVRGCPWPDLLQGGASTRAHDALAAARDGRSSHFETPSATFTGDPRYWSISVSPITGRDGRVARILSVSRDHTALEQARERQRLLNGELAHRLKNTMSVITAIAHQTLGRTGDRAAVSAFSSRLIALSRAHDVLVAQSWVEADFAEVSRGVLDSFNEGERIAIAGPDVAINARAALSLSLLLHELGTNATKYGALSVADGRVALSWRVEAGEGGGSAGPLLRVTWQERGGPPASEPERQGFGSRIIRMGLTGAGGTTADYACQGLTLEIVANLEQLRQG